MTVRNFKGDDVIKLVDCFNSALPHNTIDKDQFIKKVLLEENFDPDGLFIVENDGRISGFVCCVYRKVPIDAYTPIAPTEGWISAFAVNEKESFFEIGNALLDSAENYFAMHKKSIISTGYYPLYLFQGVSEEHCPEYIELFEKRGYSCSRSIARRLELENYIAPQNIAAKKEKLESLGIYVGAIKDEHVCSLVDCREGFNSASSAYEFKLRLLDLDYERIRIAAKDGHVIGVCVFGDPYGSAERFGPFAVSKEYQGMGIGSVLMNECLSEMKKRGLSGAWMQWTPTSGAADAMYKKIGFKQTKTYVTFYKKTEETAK